jgi:sugar/nucleoside kinase (ribokinase family)
VSPAGAVRIVSAGDLMVDVLAWLPGPLAAGSDTPAPIRFGGGGAAANVAAWSAAAGAEATFLGCVGADVPGREAVAGLAAAGVRVLVTSDPEQPTGTCIVLVDPARERTMIPSAGANAGRGERPALPDAADWLCLSGYPLLRDATRGWARSLLAQAGGRGWSVAVDAASAAPLEAFGADAFLELLGGGIVLLANEDEALVLTGVADPAEAARLLATRVGAAVVKCGAAGVVWSDGGAPVTVPASPADVLDTTGAGDAFAAGFLAAGGTGVRALEAGVALAARAIAQLGARPEFT